MAAEVKKNLHQYHWFRDDYNKGFVCLETGSTLYFYKPATSEKTLLLHTAANCKEILLKKYELNEEEKAEKDLLALTYYLGVDVFKYIRDNSSPF